MKLASPMEWGPRRLRWTPGAHSDESFRARFLTVPDIIDRWISEHRNIAASEILDFGCGEGACALGLALNYEPRSVVGVDIMPDPARCLPLAREHLGLESLPGNLRLHRVAPGSLHDPEERFDLIYSWSVFEHVDQRLLDATLKLLRASLRPDGLLLVQIAPLYYSAEGSHLLHKVPEPWGHLATQHSAYYEKLCSAVAEAGERQALWSTFRTLNRITADALVGKIVDAGFQVVRTHKTRDAVEPPPPLTEIFQRDVLTTNQIVVLARPDLGEAAPMPRGPVRRKLARIWRRVAADS